MAERLNGYPPRATYRVQLNSRFIFKDAARVVPYLRDLGISHLYASPILMARTGSGHCYDGTDPTRLNPELGSRGDFEALVNALRSAGMGLIADIVPNHLAISEENPWLMDVLRHGQASPYAGWFDIRWEEGAGKIVLPLKGDSLERILDADCPPSNRHYEFVDWREAADRVNYRRFFDINHLIGLRQEDPDVFAATHALIFELIDEGLIDGLRVDHVDGLLDPTDYLNALRERIGPDRYLVVEKILLHREALPAEWPVDGTTGYDFAALVNAVLVDPVGYADLRSQFQRAVGDEGSFADMVREEKQRLGSTTFRADLQHMARSVGGAATRLEGLLLDAAVRLPRYRTYLQPGEAESLLGKPLAALIGAWQQFTGPLMAKGLEDSALYRHFPLTSLMDVGTSVELENSLPGVSELHASLNERRTRWPGTMNATSTHDSKRSEDVRARIHVLAEMPDEWDLRFRRWTEMNAAHEERGPDARERWLIYQTLLGAWPISSERMVEAVIKSIREAGLNTSWAEINEPHEEAVRSYVEAILDEDRSADFLDEFAPFAERVARLGAWNSLSMALLKLVAPGVPDFFQGSEVWKLDLVDPDNRRPVDFGALSDTLRSIPGTVQGLTDSRENEGIKQLVVQRALAVRAARPELFAEGDYVPLRVSGTGADCVVAFGRHLGEGWALAVASRFPHRLAPDGAPPIGRDVWAETALVLPADAPAEWRAALTGARLAADDHELPVAEVLRELPVALLEAA